MYQAKKILIWALISYAINNCKPADRSAREDNSRANSIISQNTQQQVRLIIRGYVGEHRSTEKFESIERANILFIPSEKKNSCANNLKTSTLPIAIESNTILLNKNEFTKARKQMEKTIELECNNPTQPLTYYKIILSFVGKLQTKKTDKKCKIRIIASNNDQYEFQSDDVNNENATHKVIDFAKSNESTLYLSGYYKSDSANNDYGCN
ncbi:MAG: hypothetical protein R3B45_15125 [Bdellovibrionota bacterium]